LNFWTGGERSLADPTVNGEIAPIPAVRRGARPGSLHTATGRQGRIRRAGDKTLRDASSRATKAFYPALSLCDLIFSGVFERNPRLRVAIGSGQPQSSQTGASSRQVLTLLSRKRVRSIRTLREPAPAINPASALTLC